MNQWKELRKRQRAEVAAFPIYFAFTDESFDQLLVKLGLTRENYEEHLCSVLGGVVLKKDRQALSDMLNRHEMERKAVIASDPTGDGIIFDMFYAELIANEYGYTGVYGDTLDSLGYSMADIEADPRLLNGLEKAAVKILEEEDETDG